MAENKNAKSNFLIGAFIIAASHIIVKLIGAVYKIPLDRMILGANGIGIYQAAYQIYNWLFVISTAGLPVAISKMVAEARALGNYKEAEKIFKISRNLLFVVGLIAFFILFVFAGKFAKAINEESTTLTMMVMAPSLFFVAISSSYRGYYQGRNNMMPTAISEIIESLCKLIFGLSFANFAMKIYDKLYIGSAAAMAGVTLGTFVSFIYLVLYHCFKKEKIEKEHFESDTTASKEILSKLVKLAVPVTLGVSVFTLTSLIDTAMVMNQLGDLGYENNDATSMYGYLSRAITLFNLPPTIIAAIAISIVPAITSALTASNKTEASKNVKSALKITVLFAMPCAVGLSVLAKPVLELLYNDGNYSFLLNIMGISVLFVTVVQVSNAMLQAYGKPWVPVIDMLIGGFVKIIVNHILVSRPEININGAPIGTLLCYFTVMSLNIIRLKRISGVKFKITDFIIKPVLLGIITAVSAFYSYGFIIKYTGNVVSTALSISFAAVCYLIALLVLKALSKEEIVLLPKGEKILKIMERYKLI